MAIGLPEVAVRTNECNLLTIRGPVGRTAWPKENGLGAGRIELYGARPVRVHHEEIHGHSIGIDRVCRSEKENPVTVR
jgi:hypothetical protein